MHIQFKGLLMGWYHVNRIGKGICLGNVDEVHYNEDFIAKHTPTKDEALELKQRDIRDDELEGYETWPLFTTTALCPCAIVLAKLLTALVRTAKPQP